MNIRAIAKAFRLGGIPVTSLALLCIGLGALELSFDPGAAVALFVAGIGALTVFVLIAGVIVPDEPRLKPLSVRTVDRRRHHR